MRRHPVDLTSLVAGLLFAGISGAYLLSRAAGVAIQGAWLLPVALIGVGAAGLAGSISRARRAEQLRRTTTPDDDLRLGGG